MKPHHLDHNSQAKWVELFTMVPTLKDVCSWEREVLISHWIHKACRFTDGKQRTPWLWHGQSTQSNPISAKHIFSYQREKEMWDVVETYLDVENLAQIIEIRTSICKMKQGGQSVTKYYSMLGDLWQELDQYCNAEWEYTNNSARYNKMLEKEKKN